MADQARRPAGYEIECIDNTSVENILTRGKTYTALYVTDFSVVVLNDLGTHSGCSRRRFVLAEPLQ